MNLSPLWIPVLEGEGHECIHWSSVGDPKASDDIILAWEHHNGFVVLTHDLDFGAILAATFASSPSVIQVRAQDVMPSAMGPILLGALREFLGELQAGALIVIEEARARVRILPLR